MLDVMGGIGRRSYLNLPPIYYYFTQPQLVKVVELCGIPADDKKFTGIPHRTAPAWSLLQKLPENRTFKEAACFRWVVGLMMVS